MDKKRVIVIVSAVILIIVILVVIMMFWKKGSVEHSGGKIEGSADEMGIHYGGSFNEFQYQEETENSEEESTEVDLDGVAAEIKDIEAEFKKDLPGDILKEDEEELEKGNRVSERSVVNSNNREEKESENIGVASDRAVVETDVPMEEAEDDGEITPHIIQSSGYAEHEVLCDAESLEAAESIAAQIGGVVLTCQDGVATIQIEEHVDTLLERLEQQGSSLELYRNYYISAP